IRQVIPLLQQQRLEHQKWIEGRPAGSFRLQPAEQLLEAIPLHISRQPLQRLVPPDRRRHQSLRKAQLVPFRHPNLSAPRFLFPLNHTCRNSQRSPLWGGVGGGGSSVRHHYSDTALPPTPALPHKGGGSTPSV